MQQIKTKRTSMVNDLTQGPILRKLLVFALPFMAANLLNTLYTLVDMAVIGKFLGSEALSAASNSGQITMMLYAVGIGLDNGGQVFISQLTGAGKREEYPRTIGTLMSFGILSALVMTVIGIVFARPLVQVLNTPAAAEDMAVDYLITCAFGFVFCVGFHTVCAILRGMGDSRTPFLISAVAAVMNVILDLVFVALIPMGVTGAALATALSQLCSFVFAILYLYPRREALGFDFKLRSFRIDGKKLAVILRLSVPMMVSSVCITISMLFINRFVNPFGVVASAVNGVGNKLNSIMQIVTHATNTAVAGFVGQNMGAGRPDRAKKGVLCGLGIGLLFWVFVSSVCLFAPRFVFGLFSNEEPVLELAVSYLRIAIFGYLAYAIMAPGQGLMNGVGATTLHLGVSLLDGVVARIGLSLLFGLSLSMGLRGFWIGSMLATYVTVLLVWVFFFFGKWESRRLVQK